MFQNYLEKLMGSRAQKRTRGVCEERAGTVLAARKDENGDGLILQFEDGSRGFLSRENLDIREIKQSLLPYVGKKMLVQLSYQTRDGWWQCSRKELQERKREELLEKLSDGRCVMAQVETLQEFGAFLTIDGVSVRLANVNFAIDYTRVMDVYKKGDQISVRLLRVTSNGVILVQAETLYCGSAELEFDTFARDQVFFGRIRSLKEWGCFVGIAPGVDVLTPVPELGTQLIEGMAVYVRITKVDADQKRLRGRVLCAVEDETQFKQVI